MILHHQFHARARVPVGYSSSRMISENSRREDKGVRNSWLTVETSSSFKAPALRLCRTSIRAASDSPAQFLRFLPNPLFKGRMGRPERRLARFRSATCDTGLPLAAFVPANRRMRTV